MGFNGNFFERASDEDIENRINNQKLEFLWEPEFYNNFKVKNEESNETKTK